MKCQYCGRDLVPYDDDGDRYWYEECPCGQKQKERRKKRMGELLFNLGWGMVERDRTINDFRRLINKPFAPSEDWKTSDEIH